MRALQARALLRYVLLVTALAVSATVIWGLLLSMPTP
jgi:hypothetical protein